MKKHLQILVTALLFWTAFTNHANAQTCGATSTWLSINSPTTVNGVQVTRSFTGNTTTMLNDTDGDHCGGALMTGSNNYIHLTPYYGNGSPNSSVTFTFTKDVNDIVFQVRGMHAGFYTPAENITITTNAGGTVTTSDLFNCNLNKVGNTYTSTTPQTTNYPKGDAGIIKVSSTIPYTTLTITHNGNTNNAGAAIGLCQNSIVPAAPKAALTKAVSPTTITDGGTATYTFTVTNTATGSVALSGLNFTDTLPSGLRIAATPNVVVSGLTAGTVTAAAGGTSVVASGYSIAANTTATIKVDVTNATGQFNASCGGNPAAFTNSAANMSNLSLNLTNNVTPVCLVVEEDPCNAGTADVPLTGNTLTNQ